MGKGNSKRCCKKAMSLKNDAEYRVLDRERTMLIKAREKGFSWSAKKQVAQNHDTSIACKLQLPLVQLMRENGWEEDSGTKGCCFFLKRDIP